MTIRSRYRWSLRGVAVAAMLMTLGATLGTIPAGASSPAPALSLVPAVVTPEAVIPIAVRWPWLIISDGNDIWILAAAPGTCALCPNSTTVARIDPGTNLVAVSVDLGTPDEIDHAAVGGGGLWIADFDASTVLKLDPVSLRLLDTIPVGPNPEGIAYVDGSVWVAEHRGGTVSSIDAATDRVTSTVTVGRKGASGPNQLGIGDGSVWVGIPNEAQVVRIDAQTGAVQARVDLPGTSEPDGGGFGISGDAVWGTVCAATCLVSRIDPATDAVMATIDLGGLPDDATMVNGAPWIARGPIGDLPGALVRIDPATDMADRTVSPAPDFSDGDMVFAADSWWLSDPANQRVLRLPASALNG